jgi:hypothetical protein
VYPSFDLRRVNTLELAMLDALKYVIRVSASEYAKYYFHLRSMLARLGLNNQTGTRCTRWDDLHCFNGLPPGGAMWVAPVFK